MKVEVNGDRKPKPLSTTGSERNWRTGLCSEAITFASASYCQSFRANVSSFFCWFFAALCFFVLVNLWWDGVNGLPYLRFFSQFAFVSSIASALIVVALCLVRFRSSLVAFVLGCLWPVLLVLGLLVYTVATVN